MDTSCGYLALAVAKYFVENGDKNKFEWQRKNHFIITFKLSLEICRSANINFTSPMDFDIFEKIQTVFSHQIIVYGDENNILYKESDKFKQVFLYNANNHYDMITPITGFLGVKNYCSKCNKGYQNMHNCSEICNACYTSNICDKSLEIICNIFNRTFFNPTCIQNHLSNNTCIQKKSAQFV